MTKRGYRYYLVIFVTSIVALIVYSIYLSYTGEFSSEMIFSFIPIPFVFTTFIFVFDRIFAKIFPGSKEPDKDQELEKYLKEINKRVGEIKEFELEDYRRLQENERFQKAVFQAYVIHKHGESAEINYTFLEKKFKKSSREYTAIMMVINETKKMTENS